MLLPPWARGFVRRHNMKVRAYTNHSRGSAKDGTITMEAWHETPRVLVRGPMWGGEQHHCGDANRVAAVTQDASGAPNAATHHLTTTVCAG